MKKRAAQILALFATTYLVIVLFAAGWAVYIDVTMLHSQREHLAPDILLLILTLPLSSSLAYLYDARSAFFPGPLVQVGWLTLCGLGQAWFLFSLMRVLQKKVRTHNRQ
jgi:hypothetical protein